ncbi:proton-conducting transporter membrane subunit [Mycobacterium sp. EPa45]|uniref:proton-conducting transporter transmembrane domain-containing protein n=1 Tax=Mycobacterium sp. EPa45 TaxID=1545728 RepID=UPI00069B2EF7|nr:proton-conducting transporter membrane subunit [Mycobacterium sp. EPa45]
MLTDSNELLLMMLTAPAAFALVAAVWSPRGGRVLGRGGAVVAAFGFLAAAALAVEAGREPPVTTAVGGLVVAVDRLAAVLLLLIFGVSTVVQVFAIRYLAGDRRAAWFTAGASLLTSASAGLVTATTLFGLALSWTIAGVALCLLLGMYWHLPAARDGVRRTATAFVIGDLALWTAVALATAHWGSIDLRALNVAERDGPLVPTIACLVVIAALSRSAQWPFHRWLPATLAAPTPVSALLHAGVVNAGGILLVRLAPVVSGDLARAITIAAGAATLTYGAVVMLVRADVKGALANSTMAQMGFMILTCGLGLWAATIFHLVAHGFYKATLFLSSGSAIAARRRASARPPARAMSRRRRTLTAVGASVLPALALYTAVQIVSWPPGQHAAEQALLIFALATGAAVTWGWLTRRRSAAAAVTAASVLFAVATAYLGLITMTSHFLAPALSTATPPAAVAWIVAAAVSAVLAGLAVVRSMPDTAIHRAIYARAVSTGYIAPSLPTPLTGARS